MSVEIYESARRHGASDDDIRRHAVEFALVAADEDNDNDNEDGSKVLYLGPDRAGNLLEVVSVRRDDDTEIVIHAMAMRRQYQQLLQEGGNNDA